MQVLEAADGAQAAGWPAFHKSKVHASPLLYDVDSDGVQDILVATYDGQILAFRDTVRQPIRVGALPQVCDSASAVSCTSTEISLCWLQHAVRTFPCCHPLEHGHRRCVVVHYRAQLDAFHRSSGTGSF